MYTCVQIHQLNYVIIYTHIGICTRNVVIIGLLDDPVLGLSPLPSSPEPSLELPSHPYSQELIEHKARQTTAG